MKDILDVIGKTVELEKKGKRYVGLCPFHEEKTPSFSVSQRTGRFFCFSCGAEGDADDYTRMIAVDNLRLAAILVHHGRDHA